MKINHCDVATVKASGFTAADLLAAGATPAQLASAGFTPQEVAAATDSAVAQVSKFLCLPSLS